MAGLALLATVLMLSATVAFAFQADKDKSSVAQTL